VQKKKYPLIVRKPNEKGLENEEKSTIDKSYSQVLCMKRKKRS